MFSNVLRRNLKKKYTVSVFFGAANISFFFFSKLFSGFLVWASCFVHTLLSNGCADIQIRGLVFDVLCQSENIVQLGMTLFQVILCHLPAQSTNTQSDKVYSS